MNLAASLQPLTLSQPDLEPSRLLMARTAQAEASFKAFDFTAPVFESSAWLDTHADNWSKVCYCEALFSTRFVLHVRFAPGTAEVAEVYAVQMSSRYQAC